MSAGDVIALLSLVFALLTYVYSIALWPRLRMLIDEDVWLYFFIDRHGEHLCLKSYFTFFNSGAQPGAIANLLGTLSLVDGTGKAISWDLRWNWFGRDTVFFGAQGIAREWQMRRTMLSPQAVTSWEEIMVVHAD